MKQHTLKRYYSFEGKGLHTGQFAHLTLKPAGPDTGIVFVRTDIGPDAVLPALGEFVSDTSRSTTLSDGAIEVHTVEHLLSALTGLGVDNAFVEIDNIEVPILDGSARFYVEAIAKDGLEKQNAERKYIELSEPIEIVDEKRGSSIRIEPAAETAYDATIDFNSRVLGIQRVHWDKSVDYKTQIASCRTFVFLHEIEPLLHLNLIKGGSLDNALVFVNKELTSKQLKRLAKTFNKDVSHFKVHDGVLNTTDPYFPNEPARHKLLDFIGDVRLVGMPLNAQFNIYKPGHRANNAFARFLTDYIKKNPQ